MVKVSVNPSQAALLCKLAEEGRLDYVGLFIMADGWTVAQKNPPHHCRGYEKTPLGLSVLFHAADLGEVVR